VTIEEIEDEEEVRMREKPKAKGPGILEDVEESEETEEKKEDTEKKAEDPTRIKIHPVLEFRRGDRVGKEERFLQRIRETKRNTMNMLKNWTSKDRSEEVTVFLLQSLLTAPWDQAIATLRDLKQPRHYIASLGGKYSLHLPITFQTTDTNASFVSEGLVDCGATGLYIDQEYAQSLKLNLQTLSHPIPVYNADKTPNKSGPIRQVVTLRMKIGDHVETATFAVTNTGRDKIILGYSWLRRHNPNVDWKANKLIFNRCPSQCSIPQEWENGEEEVIRGIECAEDDWMEEIGMV